MELESVVLPRREQVETHADCSPGGQEVSADASAAPDAPMMTGSNCCPGQGQAPSRDEGKVGRPGAEREQQVRGRQGCRPHPPSMEGYTNHQDSVPPRSYPTHKAARDLCPPAVSGAGTLVLPQCLE